MGFSRTVSFKGKHGRITSIRTSFGNGNTLSTGLFGKTGGVTLRTGNITTRFSKGQAIGFGLKNKNKTTYWNKNLKKVSQLTRFR